MNDSKVAPVEAQAVPDQPVAKPYGYVVMGHFYPSERAANSAAWAMSMTAGERLPITEVFTRPTPAADPVGINGLTEAETSATASVMGLVAASPAAAAGVPTVQPTGWKWRRLGETEWRTGGMPAPSLFGPVGQDTYEMLGTFDSAPASPVAPAGAPTETLKALLDHVDTFPGCGDYHGMPKWVGRLDALRKEARALLSAQGCELATAATKQQREHSVHLAATPIDQDFRRLPASSEAAPSADWQPIETAPRDTRSRLVWCPERGNIYAVAWDEFDGAWRIFGGYSLGEVPTHWMPLPAQPKEQQCPA